MKKIMLFAAACAALAACTKNIDTTTPEKGTAFEKGQKVTLIVNAGEQTRVTSSFNGTTGAVDFKWETDDKIKVTVGTKSAEFTLSSEAGTATAEFTGIMPAAGDNFDVQYPVTDPELATQTYVANGLPKDMMKFTATDCTLGNDFTLTPQNAALRLNLYGGAREVSQIVVNGSSSSTYTLSISPAVTVGKDKDNATPFLIVLPATESFVSATVTANALTATKDNTQSYGSYGIGYPISASTTFTATEAKNLTAGSILNMKAVSLTTVWAPVNCGYDSSHTYGLIYQWGRTAGGTYDSSWSKPSSHTAEAQTQSAVSATWDANGYNKSPQSNKFYKNNSSPKDWYTNNSSKQLTEWPMTAPAGTSGIGNPCPKGWRVPTYDESCALYGWNSSPSITTVGGQRGCYFNGTSSASSGVFLPAAGYRINDDGSVESRGFGGFYWSSSASGSYAWGLYFNDSRTAYMDYYVRAVGFAVRCVQE